MGKLFIRPLFFSSDQEIIHNSLSSNNTATSNAFPIAADIEHIKYPSIENISNFTNNESMANEIENSTNRPNYTYTNVSVLKKYDTNNIQKQPDVNIVESHIEIDNNPNDRIEASQLIETYPTKTNSSDIENLAFTNDLNTIPNSNEAMNKTYRVSDITEFKNQVKGTNGYKLMNKKAIFVGILVSLARKRLK